jgi:hypothetical protein
MAKTMYSGIVKPAQYQQTNLEAVEEEIAE